MGWGGIRRDASRPQVGVKLSLEKARDTPPQPAVQPAGEASLSTLGPQPILLSRLKRQTSADGVSRAERRALLVS